ncbi:MAG: DUF72 domain-containing protein [Verrucomicrobia bacterium]|nr:DUF72 domain-containing protein [Verrucomicrobiota bacterium]
MEAGAQLAYYSRYLSAVEIDSTFYSIPRAEIVARWADATPDDFVFTAKLPRMLTHDARLRLDAPIPGHPGGNGRAVLRAFLGSLRPLGEKLGAVLVQLPPSFRSTPPDVETLRRFLDALPVGGGGNPAFAVEFRHPSWHRPAIAQVLREHGVAWCWNDTSPLATQAEAPFEFLPQTADFLYVRLLGDLQTKFRPDTGERQYRYGRLLWPRADALESWAARLRQHLEPATEGAPCRQIYVLVNNHYEGFSPLTCQRLGRLLGVQLELPALAEQSKKLPAVAPETDEQLKLF